MQETWYENSPFRQVTDSDAEQQWREAVEKTLGGQPLDEALTSKTLDDITISPLYQQQNPTTALASSHAQWRIAQTFAPEPADNTGNGTLNTDILDALAGGVSSIELNQPGNTVEQLDLLLTGVFPEMIHLSLPPAADNLADAALLEGLWRQRGLPLDSIRGAFNADPLGSLALTGRSTDQHYAASLSDLAAHTQQHLPQVSSVCVDTSPYHNAGASEAQELGFALASATEYLRSLTAAGMEINAAASQMVFRYSLDSDFFLSVAKMRAARHLWQQVLTHCGVSGSATIALDAQSGIRCLSARDPWVNILRVTSQAFAAMVGGANSFNSAPYDINLEKQSNLGRRIARNTQLILTEESHIGAVSDPLRGSGFIEDLTQQLCHKAWAIFQDIESRNGMWDTLQTDYIVDAVGQTRDTRRQAVAQGRTAIIGVTEYPDTAEQAFSSVAQGQQPSTASQGNRNEAKLTTQTERVNALLNGSNRQNIDTSHLYNNAVAPALTAFRDAALFENMLTRCQRHTAENATAPTVLLVTLGNASDFTARTTYCRNFFAIAGVNTITIALDELSDQHVNNTPITVLCSSNKQYANTATDACKKISAYSDSEIWLAGKAGELEHQLMENGMTQQIHTQCDKAELLNRALELLAVA